MGKNHIVVRILLNELLELRIITEKESVAAPSLSLSMFSIGVHDIHHACKLDSGCNEHSSFLYPQVGIKLSVINTRNLFAIF
jgi:hypothetical protein